MACLSWGHFLGILTTVDMQLVDPISEIRAPFLGFDSWLSGLSWLLRAFDNEYELEVNIVFSYVVVDRETEN